MIARAGPTLHDLEEGNYESILEYDTLMKLQQKVYTSWVPATKTALKQEGSVTITSSIAHDEKVNPSTNFDAKSFYLSMVGLEDNKSKLQVTSNGIAHIFDQYRNSDVKPPIFYEIPPSNKGFQIMIKNMQWNGEALGPPDKSQQASLYPVATQFKTDRTGIGSRTMNKLPKRVTHFASRKYDAEGRPIIPTNSNLIIENQVHVAKQKLPTRLLQKKSAIKILHRKERARKQHIQNKILGRDEIPE
jgi:hypothetical protein